MKKKGIIITATIVGVLLLAALIYYFMTSANKDYITIIFDADGGLEVSSMKVERGEIISKLPTTTKTDYTFVGWYNGETLFTTGHALDKDTVLKAKWEALEKYFTITFDSKGGNAVEPLKVVCDKTLPALPKPTKSGYNFVSWYDTHGKTILEGALLSCEDITLYADWKEVTKTFTVTFDSKGGSSVSKMTVECDKALSLPKNPTRDGYTFTGWVDKNNKAINNGAKLSCNDTTLYATWKENVKKVTIKFDTDGGNTISDITVECGKTLPTLPTPTKANYKFLGWKDKNNKTVTSGSTFTCENMTLTASWEKQKSYSCPTGYTLSGTKCVLSEDAKTKCSGERVYDYNGKCIKVNNEVRKVGSYSCPELNIAVGSYAGKEKGELVYAGTYFCYYHKLSYNTESACTSLTGQYGNFVWRSSNSTCYVEMTNAKMSCDSLSNYQYVGDPNKTFTGINGLNGGCFPEVEKTKYCDEGYTLTSGKCIKTIDATLK